MRQPATQLVLRSSASACIAEKGVWFKNKISIDSIKFGIVGLSAARPRALQWQFDNDNMHMTVRNWCISVHFSRFEFNWSKSHGCGVHNGMWSWARRNLNLYRLISLIIRKIAYKFYSHFQMAKNICAFSDTKLLLLFDYLPWHCIC